MKLQTVDSYCLCNFDKNTHSRSMCKMWKYACQCKDNQKWKWSCSVVSDSLWPHGLWPVRLFCPWDFPGRSTGVDCHFLSNPGVEPGSPALQADALPSEPPEKPKNNQTDLKKAEVEQFFRWLCKGVFQSEELHEASASRLLSLHSEFSSFFLSPVKFFLFSLLL